MRTQVLLALGGAAVLGACTPTAMVRIHNPAQIGHVEPNRVQLTYARAESYSGLPPGTLSDEASLVSYQPSGACFDVTLRNEGDEAPMASLSSYEVTAEADDHPLGAPAVTATASTSAQYQGQVPHQEQTGTQTTCAVTDSNTGVCQRWDTQPVYATVMVPGVITVVTGGGQVCFPNTGALSPRTQELDLAFDQPGAGLGARRFKFQWQFVAGGSAPPQGNAPPTTAPVIEPPASPGTTQQQASR